MKIAAQKTKAMMIFEDRKHRVTSTSFEPFYFTEELITSLGPRAPAHIWETPFLLNGRNLKSHTTAANFLHEVCSGLATKKAALPGHEQSVDYEVSKAPENIGVEGKKIDFSCRILFIFTSLKSRHDH
ncbi:hypothetical protein T265_01796 [Opisthorchis viverrini]|uniref:Uncharacterized protein n=1 Tax=Opisthorchis viverrini TaxID=6198 RepID=A0A075AIP9_OPIVI|nr:hypothetical protein T265_01796 [Opisthorchis viverrini]KER32014.1 hypothetical protein T265_01796 [Opisthorchis viverrini]